MISGINKPDTGIAPNYSDLNTFWNDFKKYAQAKDIAKLATMTYFKFMNQNNMLSKQEFLKDFSFQRSALKALAKARPPKYNGTKKSDFDTNKYLGKSYTAIAGGALLTFCKIRGQWKFTGVNYGE